eukprot:jgi/Tetstr1/427879/TSEL_017955.t1
MHNGDTFALAVVRERYLRHGTENLGSAEFTELLELYKDRVYDANIASVAKTSARQRFGDGPEHRNDCNRDGGGGNRDGFKNARPARKTAASRTTTDVTKDCGPMSELMRGSIEALFGTDVWGANVPDLLTTSLAANTCYSSYEGKIRLFTGFDEEGVSAMYCTKATTCVRYLA